MTLMIDFGDIYPGIVTFFSDCMSHNTIDLNSINSYGDTFE